MKLILASFVLIFLLGGNIAAYAESCVLPDPNGGSSRPSPPSVEGEIASRMDGQIVLKDAKATAIRFNEKTVLFTIFGADVEPKELKAGQHVFVWYVNCEAPAGAPPIAAVIQLCSIGGDPCPK